MCTPQGIPVNFTMLPAALHDLTPLYELTYDLPPSSRVLGDKGYNSAADEQSLAADEVRLIPIRKRNMKHQHDWADECPSQGDGAGGPRYLSPYVVQGDTVWLKLSVWVATLRRYGAVVHVQLYLQQAKRQINEPLPGNVTEWGESEEALSARLSCKGEDAVAFGAQLYQEIQEVERQREAVGIPDYDDPHLYE